ncbi:MAG: DHH family phosphoesterase [Desulfovibrio sp.]|nr:DHH family phosphoesterase [Desulfovibrio sp.]
MDVQSLLDALGGGRPVYIQTHDYPDPDAIASAFGMQQFLRHFGVDSTLTYVGDAERASLATAVRTFGIELVNASQLSMAEDDPILLVDGQKLNANMTDLPGDEVACIDHHPIFKDISYRYADIRSVGACSSIVADYFFRAHVPMSADVATMLLFGLQIDTSYMTRGVADLDLDVFPRLFRQADKTCLEIVESRSLEFTDLQAFGAAINSIRIFGRTGIAFIPFACPDALIAQVADFILSLAEVDVAIIRARREAGLKFSVRSVDPSVHSGYLLSHVMPPFGNGGGHAGMAGGFVGNEGIAESGLDLKSFMRMLDDRFLRYIAEHQKEGA